MPADLNESLYVGLAQLLIAHAVSVAITGRVAARNGPVPCPCQLSPFVQLSQ